MALTTKTTKKKTGETTTTTGVESDGKFYPTSNPDFKPSPQGTVTQIKFNQNGSVDYTPKGSTETFNLSKQEYDALLGKKGFVTEKTKAIESQQLNPLQAQQEALAEQQATELKQVGQQDFTQLGQEPSVQTQQVSQGMQADTSQAQAQTPLQRVGSILTGQNLQQQAQAQGGELLTGSPMIAPAGAIPAIANVGGIFTKAKNAITALREFPILSKLAAGATVGYGLLTSAKVKDLEGDVNDLVSISRQLASQVNSGADPVEVRQQLLDMENEIKDKIAEINVAKRYSIKDRIIGSDSQEYARKQLTLITLRRQAVERYMLTNDLNSFNAFMGSVGAND